MELGTYISGGKTHTLTAPISPLMIEKSKETFDRLFLEAETPKAYFGNSKHLFPYVSHALVFDGSAIPFNPLQGDAHHVLEACKAIWDYGSPTIQIDKDMLTAILALKETGGTFFQLAYLFISDIYRQKVISKLSDPVLIHYWTYYDSLSEKDRSQLSAPILNRLIPLITDKAIRRIVSQPVSFKMPDVLFVDLLDTPRFNLLSALIMSQCTGTVFINHPKVHIGNSTPVIHIDYLDELPDNLKNKMLNTAIIMTTRVGVVDAEILEPHFNLDPQDHLSDLRDGEAFVRLEKTHRVTTYPHDLKPIGRKLTHNYRTPSDVLDDRIERFMKGLWTTKPTFSKKK